MPLPMTTTSYSSSVSSAETPDLVEATGVGSFGTAEGRARVDARLDAGPPHRADEFSPIARLGSPGIARRDVTAPRRRAGNPRAAGLVVSVIDAIAAAAIVAGSTANPG